VAGMDEQALRSADILRATDGEKKKTLLGRRKREKKKKGKGKKQEQGKTAQETESSCLPLSVLASGKKKKEGGKREEMQGKVW